MFKVETLRTGLERMRDQAESDLVSLHQRLDYLREVEKLEIQDGRQLVRLTFEVLEAKIRKDPDFELTADIVHGRDVAWMTGALKKAWKPHLKKTSYPSYRGWHLALQPVVMPDIREVTNQIGRAEYRLAEARRGLAVVNGYGSPNISMTTATRLKIHDLLTRALDAATPTDS